MTSDENTYVLDPESPTEMARLINQDHLMTRAMGGPLPEQSSLTMESMHSILDLGCGPGGWVLDTAFAFPEIEVAGIDISSTMIGYAGARARSQGLKNASFEVMDITKPLDFADASFDLVNARLLFAVLRREAWQPFLAECTRILCPGGILRLTELVLLDTTARAVEESSRRWSKLSHDTGHGFSPSGETPGIVAMLPRLFRQVGYPEVHHASHLLEFSAGTPAWADFYHNMNTASQMVQPFLIKLGLLSPEDAEQLHRQMLIEMNQEDFCGMWHFTTIWGTKPSPLT